MIISFKPILTSEFNCFDNVLINIANWYGQGYIYMFAESLPISYKKSDNIIGNNIILDPKAMFRLMKKYYGVNSFYHARHMPDKALDIIKEEIDLNNPVVIGFDTYWMPWDRVYLKRHWIYHYCIAVGYDDDKIFILDPYKGLEEIMPLSIEYFLNGIGPYITFSKVEGFNSEKITWPMVLKGTLKSLKYNQNAQNFQNPLELLARDIKMNLNIKLEFKGLSTETAWQSTIMRKISQIRIHRIAFCNILDFIYTERHRHEDLLTLSNDYKNLASLWGINNSLLYKGFFENDSTVRVKIADKIEEIINYEHAGFIKLSEIIDKYQRELFS